MLKKTLLVDLDDTLVWCGIYYAEALRNGAKIIDDAYGMKADVAEKLIRQIDLIAIEANVAAGFQLDRFPASFSMAATVARSIMGRMPLNQQSPAGVAHSARLAGEYIFDAPYELLPNADRFLERAHAAGYRIIVVTKGEETLQQKKLDKHSVFKRVPNTQYVVSKKNVDVLRDICVREDVDLETSLYVGDSLKDDIAPAMALGLYAVLVRHPEAPQWVYNNADVTPDAVVPFAYDALDVHQRSARFTHKPAYYPNDGMYFDGAGGAT